MIEEMFCWKEEQNAQASIEGFRNFRIKVGKGEQGKRRAKNATMQKQVCIIIPNNYEVVAKVDSPALPGTKNAVTQCEKEENKRPPNIFL